VVDKDGVNLQTWGIVQNVSGEDWTNVSLSLVAEAPLAFEATLATPVIPGRPKVTDWGDVIAVVPRSETSLANEPPAPPPMAAAMPAPSMPGGVARRPAYKKSRGGGGAASADEMSFSDQEGEASEIAGPGIAGG